MKLRYLICKIASGRSSFVRCVVSFCCVISLSLNTLAAQELSCDSLDNGNAAECMASPDPSPAAPKSQDPLAFSNDRISVKFAVSGVAQTSGVTVRGGTCPRPLLQVPVTNLTEPGESCGSNQA